MNTVLLVYLIFIVAPLSNFIHEIGHMIGAKLAKADEVSLYIGRGKKIYKLKFQNIEIQFRFFLFTSGLTVSKRKEEYRSIEIIYITFLGPFLNAITVFIFFLIYCSLPSTFILVILLYNAWLSVMNLVPYKVRNQRSDGYIIAREIFRKMYKNG